jgi:hypothetical protein
LMLVRFTAGQLLICNATLQGISHGSPRKRTVPFTATARQRLRSLIHTFLNPSSEEQSQQQPDWVLQMVAQRRMIRLRVFTDAASGDWSVKDYPEDAAMGGLPWVALIFSECNKTWQTL